MLERKIQGLGVKCSRSKVVGTPHHFALTKNENTFDVPELIYEEDCSALVFPTTFFFDDAKFSLGWDDSVYAAECRLVKDREGIQHILCDLNTAKPFQGITGTFTEPAYLDVEDPDAEDVIYDTANT